MKSIIPLVVIGLIVIGSIGVVADAEPRKTTEIVSVSGGVGHIFVEIENTCAVGLNNLEYTVAVKGGLLGRICAKETGIISFIGQQSTEVSVTNEPISGLGKICITVTAAYAEPWQGTGFIVGPIILVF
jgi:hypothetical protein